MLAILLSVLLRLPGQREPGEIWVTYRDGVTSNQRSMFEWRVGLPEPMGRTPCVKCTYKVPEGHEQFWIAVLQDFANSSIVESVSDRDAAAATHNQVAWPLNSVLVSSTEMLDAKINQYFRDKYARIATVNVIKGGDHSIELSIDKMKGQVIKERHFWERLDIYVVFFYTGNEARLYVDYDGYFATGIGSRPPPDESYSSMSKRYDGELSRYADMTTTALMSYLKKGRVKRRERLCR